MKAKTKWYTLSVFLLACTIAVVFYQMKYNTLEEAIAKSNVQVDEIYYSTEIKGNTIIFYGENNNLSARLFSSNFFGYQGGIGVGSQHFNVEDQVLTKSFSNLKPRNSQSEDDLVSFTMGGIHDDEIEKIRIKYKDLEMKEATIIETNQGRFWLSFSETPVDYDPEVVRIYQDGTEVTGWN